MPVPATAASLHIAFIEHELDGFHQSLAVYRRQVGAWYSQAVDKVSHAADLPSLLGMDDYAVTKWGKDQYGKSWPAEWRVLRGPNKGAEINIDDPSLAPTTKGPASPHAGYQTAGKRGYGGAKRGHILLELLPVSRSKIGTSQ